MKQMIKRFPTMLLAASTLCFFCVHRSKDADNENLTTTKDPVPVIATKVIHNSIELPIIIPGKLAASSEMKLSFLTGGLIQTIDVKDGATVKSGTRIALLDTTQFIVHRNKAGIALDKANRDYQRVEKLFKDSVATLEQLQNAQSARELAGSDLALANFNLKHATLYAPSNGKILKKLAQTNEIVGPGMPVVLFGSTEGKWTIQASVPDKDILLLTIGDSAQISFDAIPDKSFAAIVTKIGQVAHPVTGTFELELDIKDNHQGFRSGLIADVRVYPQKQTQLQFIPATALTRAQGNSATVWAVGEHDSLFKVTVTVYRLYQNLAAVSNGLQNVTEIIDIGANEIQSGLEPVTVQRNYGAP